MKNIFIVAYLLFVFGCDAAYAGLPPTAVKGQLDATNPTTFNMQFPLNQVVRMNGTTGYFEARNKNFLMNATFVDPVLANHWTVDATNTTLASATGPVQTMLGVQTVKQTVSTSFSGTSNIMVQTVTPGGALAGTMMEADFTFGAQFNVLSSAQVCVDIAGVNYSCVNVQAGSVSDTYPIFQTYQITFPAGANGSAYKLYVKHTQTSGASTAPFYFYTDSYVGPMQGLGTGVPNNQFSAQVSSTGVVTNQNVSGWLTSCTNAAPSVCTFQSGLFGSSVPNCTASSAISGTVGNQIASTSSTSVTVGVYNASGTITTGAFSLSCMTAGTSFVQPTISLNKLFTPQVTVITGGTTYTTPSGTGYLTVQMIGGGGGGAGDGTGGGTGGVGQASTFGTSLLSAGGGTGGVTNAATGGAGGTSSLGSGPTGLAATGGTGSGGNGVANGAGGNGASTPFGGGGAGNAGGGGAGIAYGAGGGGAGGILLAGTGGGAGGYINATIANPLSSYAVTVGAGGTSGTAGASGTAGGAGAQGVVIVTAYPAGSVPILLGSVTSKANNPLRSEYVVISGGTTPTITTQSGSFIGTLTRTSAGLLPMVFTNSFSGIPSCTCNVLGTNTGYICSFNPAPSATGFTVLTQTSGGTPTDTNLNISCVGPR